MMHKKRDQAGFTLVETLLVVGIIICLLAISAVAVVRAMSQLKITEVDNAAREIYMAAQNRAVLLKNSGKLDELVIKADGSNQLKDVDVDVTSGDTTQLPVVYYLRGDDPNMEQLLPDGTIDPALWEGDFYIVYAPESASVLDVFFAKESLSVADFPSFYETWRAAPKSERMQQTPMIGYYGGASAESGTSLSLRTPVINIYNEETLRAEVTYWVPRQLRFYADNVVLEVTLGYQSGTVPLALVSAEKNIVWGTDYDAYTYTWTLDALESGKQFKDLVQALIPDGSGLGGDFTITAEVSFTGTGLTHQVNGARKTATDNSLFAKGSGGDTAYIEYMRHLQNLRTDFSGVSEEKTAAVQIGNITCVENYAFQPIENGALRSYDGNAYIIRNLLVRQGSGAAGLFGSVQNMALSRITLVNSTVTGSGSVGAVAGEAAQVTLDGCQVYWENESAISTNLRTLLGNSEDGIHYRLTSDTAVGGLVGTLTDGVIQNSFAASTLSGVTAGGLVGASGGTLQITGSYADNYLEGKYVGGFVGQVTGTASISDGYTAGFIKSATGNYNSKAAGFCLGSGTVDMTRAYSAMLYTKDADNYPLCEKNGSRTNVYYLGSDFIASKNIPTSLFRSQCERTYADLTDSKLLDQLYGAGHVFEKKGASDSRPYNLQTTLSLTTYSYPGLAGLTHYGDWGAEFQNGSLVYYEKYADGTYSFSGGNMSLPMQDGAVSDGYAVAFLSTDSNVQNGATIYVKYRDDSGKLVGPVALSYQESDMAKVVYFNEWTGKNETYYLLPLTGEIVNTGYASPNFYQELSIYQGAEGETELGSYYYNPHFANAVLSAADVKSEEELAGLIATAEIRTPRHLYMLSTHSTYYKFSFTQEADLDYSLYTGYGLFQAGKVFTKQSPIGTGEGNAFSGKYYGNGHTIEYVVAAWEKTGEYYGLFGYNTGDIEDVVYLVTANSMGTFSVKGITGKLYVGGLVGYNRGILKNSAVTGVSMDLYAYSYGTVYVGGLVGWNQGTISGCSAEVSDVTVDTSMSNAYAGGFVGWNNGAGQISQCYAVGRLQVLRDQSGTVSVSGFAGSSQGKILQCYAAVDLKASGGADAYGFCPDATQNCVYLNSGNFSYREVNFSAQHSDPSAEGKNWSELTGADSTVADSLGMHQTAPVYGSKQTYPLPAAVKDGSGNYIHYGQWPALLDLGVAGVYYWETVRTASGEETYYISAIKADLNAYTMDKVDTLPTLHNDSSVITAYGYGYYYEDIQGMSAALTSTGIGLTNGNTSPAAWSGSENQTVNQALAIQMQHKYVFHSYNTMVPEQYGDQGGVEDGLRLIGDVTTGTWTLTIQNAANESQKLSFQLNPFFADTMSFVSSSKTLALESRVPTTEVGKAEDQPYQVRSIEQLQFINWNYTTQNTHTVLIQSNCTQYPYLSYYSEGLVQRVLYWKQSHDINGNEKTYTPIAEFYETGTANEAPLYGWFGGTYDGDAYVIQDINIQGQKSSCAGLFGVVYNGSLKDIILYSSNGEGKVTSYGGTDSQSGWYAMGALVGVAGAGSGSSIENCSVAGYTVVDQHRNTVASKWGTSVGGLIGASDMNLSGCSAVVDIQIQCQETSCMRIGGLVGCAQKSISNCYTGGSITVTDRSGNGYYFLGGITGGMYMKRLTIGSDDRIGGEANTELTSAITNCYTYLKLPAVTNRMGGVWAIGGNGELGGPNAGIATFCAASEASTTGTCTITNCYYLKDAVVALIPDPYLLGFSNGYKFNIKTDLFDNVNELVNRYINENTTAWVTVTGKNYQDQVTTLSRILGVGINGLTDVTPLTYAEMSDGTLMNKLNANGGDFATVTTKQDGEDIPGKYSFATADRLLGLNYPFPTILTQTGASGETINVHYGDWPTSDILRENGDLPVSLDLFADYDPDRWCAEWTENLILPDLLSTGGTLSVRVIDAEENSSDVVTVMWDPNGFQGTSARSTQIHIVGQKAGYAKVCVTYTVAEQEYTTTIDVSVSADLQILPEQSPVVVFANEEATAPLTLRDKNGNALDETLLSMIALQTQDIQVEFDASHLRSAAISGDKDSGLAISLYSTGEIGDGKATLTYPYTYGGVAYTASSTTTLRFIQPAVELTPLDLYLDGADTCVIDYAAEQVQIMVEGDDAPVDGVEITGLQNSGDNQLVFAMWKDAEHTTIEIRGHKTGVVGDSSTDYILLELRFNYGGSTHTIVQQLQVNVHVGAQSDSDSASPDQGSAAEAAGSTANALQPGTPSLKPEEEPEDGTSETEENGEGT